MPLDDLTDNQDQPQSNAADPALAAVHDVFAKPGVDQEAYDTMAAATSRLNHIEQVNDLAQQNEIAGQQHVQNLADFRDGMVNLAQKYPWSAPDIFPVVHEVVGGLIRTNPAMPDESRQDTYDSLTGDIKGQVAHAAVAKLAEHDETAARNLLDHPDISGALGDDQKTWLDSYIDMQGRARAADEQGQQLMLARQQSEQGINATLGHLSALYDPRSDQLNLPPRWAQTMMASNAIPPAAKRDLMQVYDRVQNNGDAPRSDPLLVQNIVNQIADPNQPPPKVGDIVNQAGQGLKMADAIMLGRATAQDTMWPQEMRAMQQTLSTAKSIIARPEYGLAGQEAFGDFTNWMLQQWRRAGPGSLNPGSDNYILGDPVSARARIGAFMPTADRLINPTTRDITGGGTEDRPSLGDIFGPALTQQPKARPGFEMPRARTLPGFDQRGRPVSPLQRT